MDSEIMKAIQEESSEIVPTEPGKLHFQNNSNANSISTPKINSEHLTSASDSITNDEENMFNQMSCTNTVTWSTLGENDHVQDSELALSAEKLLVTKKRIKSKKTKIPRFFRRNQNLQCKSNENVSKISADEQQCIVEEIQENDQPEGIDESEDVIEYNEDTNSASEKTIDQETEKDIIQTITENLNLDWSKTPSPSFSTSKSAESTTEDSTRASPSMDYQMSDFEHKVHHFNNLNPNSSCNLNKYECPWAKSSFRSNTPTKQQHSLRTPNSFIHQVMHGDFNGNFNNMPTSTQTEESTNSTSTKKEQKSSTSTNYFSRTFKNTNSTNNIKEQKSSISTNYFARPFKIPSSTQSANTQTTSNSRKIPRKSHPTTETENASYNNIPGGSTTPCSYEKLNCNFSNLIKQNFIGNTELNYLGSGVVQGSNDIFLESHYYLMINIPALDSVFTTLCVSDSQSDSWKSDYQINKNQFTEAAKNRIYELGNNLLRDKASTKATENIASKSFLNSNDNLRRHETFSTKLPESLSSNDVQILQINQDQSTENPTNWAAQYEELSPHTLILPDQDEIFIVAETDLPNQTLNLTESISYKDCIKNQTNADQHFIFEENQYENIPVIEANYSCTSANSKPKNSKNKKLIFMKSKTLDSAPNLVKPQMFDTKLSENWINIALGPEDLNTKNSENLKTNKSWLNWFTKMFTKKKKINATDVPETYFFKLTDPEDLNTKPELSTAESELYKCGAYPL